MIRFGQRLCVFLLIESFFVSSLFYTFALLSPIFQSLTLRCVSQKMNHVSDHLYRNRCTKKASNGCFMCADSIIQCLSVSKAICLMNSNIQSKCTHKRYKCFKNDFGESFCEIGFASLSETELSF